MHQHKGKCHCGSVSIQFSSHKEIAAYSSRKCDCVYCIERGIEYLSDPLGEIILRSSLPLQQEKQGSEQATFFLCASCQTVVAVGYMDKGISVGSVNATLLEKFDSLCESKNGSLVVSPKLLDEGEKVTRWQKLWSEMLLVSE